MRHRSSASGLVLLALLAAACGDGPTGPGGDGTASVTACTSGTAAGFRCAGVDLVSVTTLADMGAPPGTQLNDVWGWTDPANGREYVLVGRTDGVTFLRLSNPNRPTVVGHLPSAEGASLWRDIKVYRNHAFIVADGIPGHGMQVFDLRRLRNAGDMETFAEDARYDNVGSVHNIAINEATGFAYATGGGGIGISCGGGLHMIDVSAPTSPRFAGCFAEPATGRKGTGYTHDVQCVLYTGPDTDYTGREICLGSNETALSIADVTDKGAPVSVSTATYPTVAYVHQGWLTEDQRYFLMNDELDELQGLAPRSRMLVWDVADLDDPILVAEHLGPVEATDHNVYVRGQVAFQSNYHFGLRIVDVSMPTQPRELGFFDTYPDDDAIGFGGSWSNYPFFDSRLIAVTSSDEGLFLLKRAP